jgi:hypothetical protein
MILLTRYSQQMVHFGRNSPDSTTSEYNCYWDNRNRLYGGYAALDTEVMNGIDPSTTGKKN